MPTEETPAGPSPRLWAFLDWTRENLAQREARLSPQAIEDRFEAERLFGDDDDRGFMPSRR